MQTWFEVKVKYVKIDQDGRERKVGETFLVDAVSFTDAVIRMTAELQQMIRGEFHIDSIKKSNIIEIFPYPSGGAWYKAKITIVTIDEASGRERKVNNYFLVEADNLEQARKQLDDGLSYVMTPYSAVSISLSPIVDVFPYFENKLVAL